MPTGGTIRDPALTRPGTVEFLDIRGRVSLAVRLQIPGRARKIIEERLGSWFTLSVLVLVAGIVAALYLF